MLMMQIRADKAGGKMPAASVSVLEAMGRTYDNVRYCGRVKVRAAVAAARMTGSESCASFFNTRSATR